MRRPVSFRWYFAIACLVMAGLHSNAAVTTSRPSISIAVFDPAIPEDPSVYRDLGIFPRIRRVEAMLWPFQLRQALLDTERFRVVRVIPDVDESAEVLVTARILQSDGFALRLGVEARDALGKVWLDKVYEASIGEAESSPTAPDFQPLFDAVAADLGARAATLDGEDVRHIGEVSVLRYASILAPRAFDGYLEQGADGSLSLNRLPAKDDPMIERVKMVRESEFVVSDVIDERFVELNEEIRAVHDLWRQYRRQNVRYQVENARRANSGPDDLDRASFEHLKRLYDVYKWDRLTAQEQDRLAVAFNNEVGPKVDDLEERVSELEVWVDRKYAEWNRLLEALFEVEMRPEAVPRGAP